MNYVTSQYPPVFLMTAAGDFLREQAPLLVEKDVYKRQTVRRRGVLRRENAGMSSEMEVGILQAEYLRLSLIHIFHFMFEYFT